MYIRRKVFSILEIDGEERLFSTTDINLEDAEERLFSISEEGEQREFARKDYLGLLSRERKLLKSQRSEITEKLLKERKKELDHINDQLRFFEAVGYKKQEIPLSHLLKSRDEKYSRALFDSKIATERANREITKGRSVGDEIKSLAIELKDRVSSKLKNNKKK